MTIAKKRFNRRVYMGKNTIHSRRGQLEKLREEVRQGIFHDVSVPQCRKMRVYYLEPGEVTPLECQDIPNIVQTKYARELRSVAWSLWEIYNCGGIELQYVTYDLWYYDTLLIRKYGDELSTIEVLIDETDQYTQQRLEKGLLPPCY